MRVKIEQKIFLDAKTGDEQLAIETCPAFDEALQRALDDPWEEKGIRFPSSCRVLVERNRKLNQAMGRRGGRMEFKIASCPVKLCFRPYIDKLTIRGKCLME